MRSISLKAARLVKINYGQANGWTCHSLRHTFITDLMAKTNNDVGTVMKYSGHKTLESFSTYLHPSDTGRILAIQALDNVDGILTDGGSFESIRSEKSVKKQAAKPLKNKEVTEYTALNDNDVPAWLSGRALASHARGQKFESSSGHHKTVGRKQ